MKTSYLTNAALMKKHYKAASFRLFVGHSRYGYFCSSLLTKRINELNAVIALSPFYSQKNSTLTNWFQIIEKQQLNSTKYYRFGIGKINPLTLWRWIRWPNKSKTLTLTPRVIFLKQQNTTLGQAKQLELRCMKYLKNGQWVNPAIFRMNKKIKYYWYTSKRNSPTLW